MAFLDETGTSWLWGQIKIFFQGRSALTAADDDKIILADNDDTESVNGSTIKKYKTLSLTNLATYVGTKIASSFAALASPAFTGTPTAPTAANGTNTTQIATTAFVQSAFGNVDALVYKGVINCSANPNYPAADAGHVYKVSVAGKIGGASGIAVGVGDALICNVDSTSAGDHATVGANWDILQNQIDPMTTAAIDAIVV